MDDAAREAAIQSLLRDSDAVPESLEIVRAKRVGDRVTVLVRWIEAPTGRSRCGAVDLVMTDGLWRAGGGWSTNGNHGSDHTVWAPWGRTSQATSGWVSDPAACTVRFRGSHGGQVDADTVENGVAILFNVTTSNDRGSTVEFLDEADSVLHTVPLS